MWKVNSSDVGQDGDGGGLLERSQKTPSTGHTIAARAVAVFDVLLDSVGILMGLFFISYLTTNQNNLSQEEKQALQDLGFLGISSVSSFNFGITLVILYLVYMTTELIFAILLLIGIGKKSTAFCEMWMTFALVNFFVKGVQFIYFLALDKETLVGVGSFFCEPLLRLGMFYVIYSYTKKAKRALLYEELNVYLISCPENEHHHRHEEYF